jgi:glycosyltransferase involved in cell wall biosynthesis
MKLLFIHPDLPAQFLHLITAFARDSANQLVCVSQRADLPSNANLKQLTYRPDQAKSTSTHPHLQPAENALLQGQAVWRCLRDFKAQQGFVPDIIIAHLGWGDALFVKDIYPNTPLLGLAEFFYHASGLDVGFDPEALVTEDDRQRVQAKNMHLLMGLAAADWCMSPTQFQRSLHPTAFLPRITALHEGIDTTRCAPNAAAAFMLPNGKRLQIGDEVVSYVARNLEPYRGFPTFMQAAAEILARRPHCQIVCVGGDGVSYGAPLADGQSYRVHWLQRLKLDSDRLHFVGKIPYRDLVALWQVTSAHLYLTYPFVLSWSVLEAMACGALVIASDTAPVREVIQHQHNGLLADFFCTPCLRRCRLRGTGEAR